MKLLKLFSFTIVCCMLPAIAPVKAAILGNTPTIEQQESSRNIANSRFDELTRGLNIAKWFAQNSYFDPNYITDKDLENIKNWGFEHVRLPINPSFLLNETNPEILNAENLSYLDSALDKIQSHNLSVIVELYSENGFNQRLATDDAFVDKVAKFWNSLAGHLSTRNPDRVFLEVLNEPAFGYYLEDYPNVDPVKRWDLVQGKLLSAIREGAPNHTVILKGSNWDNIDDLLKMKLVEDANVVYNFHFYEPFLFTHQGVNWLDEEFSALKNLPYPYNKLACDAAVANITEQTPKEWAQYYCDRQWNAAKLEQKIAKAASWAKENNVLLTANEFGAFSPYVNESDRANWVRDVRSILEKYDIGWSMWEYTGAFGLTAKDANGERILNQEIYKALAMDKPLPRRVPEPSAIAGFVVLTLAGIRLKRNR